MARQTFIIGPARNVTGGVEWRTDSFADLEAVFPSLLTQDEPAYVSYIRLRLISTGEFQVGFRTHDGPIAIGDSIDNALGPEMSSGWEQSDIAITLRALTGDLGTLTVPGPDSGFDGLSRPAPAEPYLYRWAAGSPTHDILSAWLTAALAGDAATLTSYELTIDDGRRDTDPLVTGGEAVVREDAAIGTLLPTPAEPRNFPPSGSRWGAGSWLFGNGGLSSPPFDLDGATGELIVTRALDHATQAAYTRTLRYTVGSATATIDIPISVSEVFTPPPTVATAPVINYAAWIISLPDSEPPLNIWTGAGDIEINGRTYLGFGGIVSVGKLHAELSQPVDQMTLQMSLSAMSPAQRAIFRGDPGPQRVEVGQIYSADAQNWQRIPRSFRGRLSAPRVSNNVYQIDVVTRLADIDRGRPVFWSNEHQRSRHPTDAGLQYMRELASGIDIRWPP